MITIFNRKELMVTYDNKQQADCREKLGAASIHYKVKVINRRSPSPFVAGDRARSGSFGEKAELENEYIIYVAKEDYEKAVLTVNDK